MRSALPVPHRKIVFDTQKGDVITVFHPLRSLRTLLTENASGWQLAAAGAMGVFLPYFNLYCLEIGFSGFQIGSLSAVRAAVMIIFSLLWGFWADRKGLRRTKARGIDLMR